MRERKVQISTRHDPESLLLDWPRPSQYALVFMHGLGRPGKEAEQGISSFKVVTYFFIRKGIVHFVYHIS